MRTNEELRALYESVYREGKERFFSRYTTGADLSETDAVVLSSLDWSGKSVLDVGCGAGQTISLIAAAGARSAVGIDYAASAIEEAQRTHVAPNLSFACMPLEDWTEPVDVIVSCGTIEHMDDPRQTLG